MDKCITIDYEYFKELIEKQSLYECFMNDLEYYIDDAELNYHKDKLVMRGSIEEIARKHCRDSYNYKLWDLQAKEKKEKNDGE